MFNDEFFPTPENVIEKMLDPFLFKQKHISSMKILEPSAGKGDIVNYIDERMNNGWSKTKIKCLEINPELQTILNKKYCVEFVGENFLEYFPNEYFDLIVMNPPFSNGDEHLLHAWEIMKCGDIVCLLNAETINNPYSKTRQLIKKIIEDNNGIVENVGNCFIDAERKTNVECVIVRLKKQDKKFFEGFFDELKSSKEYVEKIVDENNVMKADLIEAKIESYNAIVIMFQEMIKQMRKFESLAQSINIDVKSIFCKTIENFNISETNIDKFTFSYQEHFNDFVSMIKKSAWKDIFSNISAGTFLTSQVKKEFDALCSSFGVKDFTKNNIQTLVKVLFDNSNTIMQQAIMEAFDLLTKYNEENRVHWEGWKTNDYWRVNKKFILPFIVESYFGGGDFHVCYNCQEKLGDLDKALCFLSGKNYNKIIASYDAIKENIQNKNMKNIESEFFYINTYKKGTGHFVFKDMWLWEQFNLVACKGKNWLPNDFDGFGDSSSIWQGKCLEYKNEKTA